MAFNDIFQINLTATNISTSLYAKTNFVGRKSRSHWRDKVG